MKKQKEKLKPTDHWKGMPEFNQPDLKPFKKLVVNFETKEDYLKFCKWCGQNLTEKTISIWIPEAKEDGAYDKRYSDKSLKNKK